MDCRRDARAKGGNVFSLGHERYSGGRDVHHRHPQERSGDEGVMNPMRLLSGLLREARRSGWRGLGSASPQTVRPFSGSTSSSGIASRKASSSSRDQQRSSRFPFLAMATNTPLAVARFGRSAGAASIPWCANHRRYSSRAMSSSERMLTGHPSFPQGLAKRFHDGFDSGVYGTIAGGHAGQLRRRDSLR